MRLDTFCKHVADASNGITKQANPFKKLIGGVLNRLSTCVSPNTVRVLDKQMFMNDGKLYRPTMSGNTVEGWNRMEGPAKSLRNTTSGSGILLNDGTSIPRSDIKNYLNSWRHVNRVTGSALQGMFDGQRLARIFNRNYYTAINGNTSFLQRHPKMENIVKRRRHGMHTRGTSSYNMSDRNSARHSAHYTNMLEANPDIVLTPYPHGTGFTLFPN